MNPLSVHPVDPGVVALLAQKGGVSATREQRTATIDISQLNGAHCTNELSVLQTTAEWSGCDVYITPPPVPQLLNLGFVRVLVYAIIDGVGRVLAGSGVYTLAGGASALARAVKVASVRATKVKYEITVYASWKSQVDTSPLTVSLVASDNLGPVDPAVGVSSFWPTVRTDAELAYGPSGDVQAGQKLAWEVVAIVASNRNVAARSVLLFDLLNVGALAPGLVPVYSVQIPPGDTRSYVGPFGRRFGFQTQTTLVVALSTRPDQLDVAAADDVSYEVLVR